jgi:hypothetical protein
VHDRELWFLVYHESLSAKRSRHAVVLDIVKLSSLLRGPFTPVFHRHYLQYLKYHVLFSAQCSKYLFPLIIDKEPNPENKEE